MDIPVFDFHSDLLAYLAIDRGVRTPLDPESCCSLPQLQEGRVQTQILTLFTETNRSALGVVQEQLKCYHALIDTFPDRCTPGGSIQKGDKRVHLLLSIENAYGFFGEEGLEVGFRRLEEYEWTYMSLTWNEENRFGGGAHTEVGLKGDGAALLEYLDGKQIAIDLSHASDPLAHDVLDLIAKRGLSIIPIASHSNFRKVHSNPRNIPDLIAREIIDRGGVIGLNFVRRFVGEKIEGFVEHIAHAVSIGGTSNLVLGADLFGGLDLPHHKDLQPFFFPSLGNSGCYTHFFESVLSELPESFITQLAHQNGYVFFKRLKGTDLISK